MQTPPYYTSLKAYYVFIEAIENGHGSGQGNYWNVLVWGECRCMASEFFKELAVDYTELSSELLSLSEDYRLIGESLQKISERNLAISQEWKY